MYPSECLLTISFRTDSILLHQKFENVHSFDVPSWLCYRMRASSRFRFQDSGFAFQDSGFISRFNLLKTSPLLWNFLLKKAFQCIDNSSILQLISIKALDFPVNSFLIEVYGAL